MISSILVPLYLYLYHKKESTSKRLVELYRVKQERKTHNLYDHFPSHYIVLLDNPFRHASIPLSNSLLLTPL